MGEACGLQWQDIDLDAGELVVRRQLQLHPGRGLTLVEETKGEKDRRVPFTRWTTAALLAHKAGRADPSPAGMVFRGATGGMLRASTVNKVFHQMLDRLGLPAMRPHDCRHTCATILVAAGVPLRVVADLLGHSAIAVTANTYAHVQPATSRAAVDELESRILAVMEPPRALIPARITASADGRRAGTGD